MAIEAIEGTDKCILRGGELGRGDVYKRQPLTMVLVLVFVLQHLSVLLNLTMAWVNTKINSTSASVHNSNIVKVYGGGLFSKRLSPISLYGIL